MIKQLLENFRNHRENWIFWSIAAAGLLLRAVYWFQYSGEVYSSFAIGADIQEYDERAREILQGVIFPEYPEIHGPLFSWFLALLYRFTGSSIMAVRAILLLLNWGAYVALARLLKPQKLQFLYLALAMFVPVIFFHHGELISESLLASLFAGFLWLRMRAAEKSDRKLLAASGVILGLMILTHGIMTLFVLVQIAWDMWCKRFKNAGILLGAVVLTLLPVVTAKSCYYGKFCWVQENGAYNFWIGCNPDATGGCYLRPGKAWSRPLEAGKAEAAARSVSENRVFLGKSVTFVWEEPGKALLLPVKKIGLLLAPWEPVAGADPETLIRRTAVQRYGAGTFAALLILGGFGIYFAIRKKESAYIHFYLLTGSVTAMLILTVVSGRYRQGMMPGVILLAALGAYNLGKKAWGIIVPCLILGVIFFPLSHPAVAGTAEAASIEGEAHYRLGNLDEAWRLLSVAQAGIDHPARFDNMLGAIAEKKGDIDTALHHYQRAVADDPDDTASLLNLGHLYFFHFPEKRREALLLLEWAVEKNPALPSAYDMFGIHLAQSGDIAGALEMFELALRYEPENELYQNKVNLCRELLARKRGENAP